MNPQKRKKIADAIEKQYPNDFNPKEGRVSELFEGENSSLRKTFDEAVAGEGEPLHAGSPKKVLGGFVWAMQKAAPTPKESSWEGEVCRCELFGHEKGEHSSTCLVHIVQKAIESARQEGYNEGLKAGAPVSFEGGREAGRLEGAKQEREDVLRIIKRRVSRFTFHQECEDGSKERCENCWYWYGMKRELEFLKSELEIKADTDSKDL